MKQANRNVIHVATKLVLNVKGHCTDDEKIIIKITSSPLVLPNRHLKRKNYLG